MNYRKRRSERQERRLARSVKSDYKKDSNVGQIDRNSRVPSRPHIVCVCGSTRFRKEILEAVRDETMKGRIVLAPGVYSHAGDVITAKDEKMLNDLHLHKIQMSDSVLVVNVNGYIGEGLRREIEFAQLLGKFIVYTHF